jgi:hypothetical protein
VLPSTAELVQQFPPFYSKTKKTNNKRKPEREPNGQKKKKNPWAGHEKKKNTKGTFEPKSPEQPDSPTTTKSACRQDK